jgi:DNA modification methylase
VVAVSFTIIAAETTGRICHAMDIDARYIDVAVQRWQRMTGKAAVLVGEERTFNDIATARHSQNLLRAG